MNQAEEWGLDAKTLHRETYLNSTRVYPNAGRQQQAGKKEYLRTDGLKREWNEPIEVEKMGFMIVYWVDNSVAFNLAEFSNIEDFLQSTRRHVWTHFFESFSEGRWPLKGNVEFGGIHLLQNSFLDHVARLDTLGNHDAALDILYDKIDGLLRSERFDEVDQLLSNIDVDDLSPDLLLGILTASLPAKSKLPSRTVFFEKVETSLKDRGIWEDNLLVGLES